MEGHLGRHVLVGVVSAVEHDFGFGLVDCDVVGDLDRPDIAALIRLADREAGDDRRVGRCDRRDLRGDLGVAVVALLAGRELGRGRDGARPDGEECGEGRGADQRAA